MDIIIILKVKLLEALACLPDIIRLQQFLYEMCHLRIDETEVDSSLEEFIGKGFMRSIILTIVLTISYLLQHISNKSYWHRLKISVLLGTKLKMSYQV